MSEPVTNQRLFKCFLCEEVGGFVFMSDRPCCPKCKTDGDDPTSPLRSFVVPIVVLHYTAPLHEKTADTLSTGYLACQPTVRNGENGTRTTGEPRCVNCPACKQSEAFKKWNRFNEIPAMYAVPDYTPQGEI